MADDSISGQDLQQMQFAFGRDDLGPAIAGYLQSLWQTCHHFEKNHGAKILFCARAGVRIRHALQVFVSRHGDSIPDSWEHFWVSRMMIAKGIWTRSPKVSAELFDKEFRFTPIEVANECISGRRGRDGASGWKQARRPSGVGKALRKNATAMKDALAHLEEQSKLFERSIRDIVGDHPGVLLVDTGWMATSQRMLQEGFPDTEWWGAYFGLSADEHGDASRRHWANATGLVFQADRVDPDRPETCVIEHRHMIEDLFEPNGPSIERYRDAGDGKAEPLGVEENLADIEHLEQDPTFAGVLEYLAWAPRDPMAVVADAETAWTRLQKRVLTPTRAETRVYQAVARSADFGKPLAVPVLLPTDNGQSPEQRISNALWTSGQIALEYEDGMADTIQRKRFGLPFGYSRKLALPSVVSAERPAVAVITRTMDRPMLLRRSLLSAHRQSFRDYLQVVVCDGGSIEFTRAAIADTNIDHSKVLLVDNVANRGMEAASNIAINACDSDYVVIHDDDDTWHPDFLKETVGFLEAERGRKYGGVLTRSIYVSESVHADGIKVHETRPYRPNLTAPTFHAMMDQNTFAPISFLFRRSVYEEIGPFDDGYPVLGDWEFNLRFLERHDIALIPKDLAYYHHRDTGDVNSFGNSVISGLDKHAEQLSIMRNAYLRRASKGPVETASAAALNLTVRK